MKTQDFIAQAVNNIDKGKVYTQKRVASVMADGDRIYSYGYHYPLLFKIADKHGHDVWVCNNGGYSNTTSKHISYARSHADILAAIGGTSYGYNSPNKQSVINALEKHIAYLWGEIEKRHNADTKIYQRLCDEHREYKNYLDRLI